MRLWLGIFFLYELFQNTSPESLKITFNLKPRGLSFVKWINFIGLLLLCLLFLYVALVILFTCFAFSPFRVSLEGCKIRMQSNYTEIIHICKKHDSNRANKMKQYLFMWLSKELYSRRKSAGVSMFFSKLRMQSILSNSVKRTISNSMALICTKQIDLLNIHIIAVPLWNGSSHVWTSLLFRYLLVWN